MLWRVLKLKYYQNVAFINDFLLHAFFRLFMFLFKNISRYDTNKRCKLTRKPILFFRSSDCNGSGKDPIKISGTRNSHTTQIQTIMSAETSKNSYAHDPHFKKLHRNDYKQLCEGMRNIRTLLFVTLKPFALNSDRTSQVWRRRKRKNFPEKNLKRRQKSSKKRRNWNCSKWTKNCTKFKYRSWMRNWKGRNSNRLISIISSDTVSTLWVTTIYVLNFSNRVKEHYEELQIENDEIKRNLTQLDEDRADVISYLKKDLKCKVEEISELWDRVNALQEVKLWLPLWTKSQLHKLTVRFSRRFVKKKILTF